MNKTLFLVGIRRSGTSICRTLLMKHPQIKKLEFEPHDLMFSICTKHLTRYKQSKYHIDTIERFKQNKNQYYGAKIVINPALGYKRWIWLNHYFPDAKFIFIMRDKENTYKSYVKTDKKMIAGISPKHIYDYWYDLTLKSFQDFCYINPEKAIMIQFENLVKNADKTLKSIWNLLNVEQITGLNKLMHKPMNWKNENSIY